MLTQHVIIAHCDQVPGSPTLFIILLLYKVNINYLKLFLYQMGDLGFATQHNQM